MIESAAGVSKEVDSGPSHPSGDHTSSHPVTVEPEKADRDERPLSSEYSSPKGVGHCLICVIKYSLLCLYLFYFCFEWLL